VSIFFSWGWLPGVLASCVQDAAASYTRGYITMGAAGVDHHTALFVFVALEIARIMFQVLRFCLAVCLCLQLQSFMEQSENLHRK